MHAFAGTEPVKKLQDKLKHIYTATGGSPILILHSLILFVSEMHTLIVEMKLFCHQDTCNKMKGYSQQLYLCAAHPTPKECSAIDYCLHSLDSLLDAFRARSLATKAFVSSLRLFRIFLSSSQAQVRSYVATTEKLSHQSIPTEQATGPPLLPPPEASLLTYSLVTIRLLHTPASRDICNLELIVRFVLKTFFSLQPDSNCHATFFHRKGCITRTLRRVTETSLKELSLVKDPTRCNLSFPLIVTLLLYLVQYKSTKPDKLPSFFSVLYNFYSQYDMSNPQLDIYSDISQIIFHTVELCNYIQKHQEFSSPEFVAYNTLRERICNSLLKGIPSITPDDMEILSYSSHSDVSSRSTSPNSPNSQSSLSPTPSSSFQSVDSNCMVYSESSPPSESSSERSLSPPPGSHSVHSNERYLLSHSSPPESSI